MQKFLIFTCLTLVVPPTALADYIFDLATLNGLRADLESRENVIIKLLVEKNQATTKEQLKKITKKIVANHKSLHLESVEYEKARLRLSTI